MVAIQSSLNAGFRNAAQVEVLFMTEGFHPVTKAIMSPSFRNFVSNPDFSRPVSHKFKNL
jgi:hypothetical protein